MFDSEAFAERLWHIGGVVAVSLGGSRATGNHRRDSDWDFGLYYRGPLDTNGVRALGYEGHIVEPGAWGRLMNGGGWLRVDGEKVDVLYRDLDLAEHWLRETEAGRFEVDALAGHIAGQPTYALAAELALGKVLRGDLRRPAGYPDALRRSAPPWWLGNAAFSLTFAEGYAIRGETTACAGSLARAAIATAHARLAERGEWVTNEKGILRRAGLDAADGVLAALGAEAAVMAESVGSMQRTLGLARPSGMQADEVVPAAGDGPRV